MVPPEKRVEHLNTKTDVVLEKRPQQIDLIPTPALQNPIFRVLERVEDVMEVHVHARCKARQDLENNYVDVASNFGNVRGIDE